PSARRLRNSAPTARLFQFLSLRCRKPSGVRRHHGARAQRREGDLRRSRSRFSNLSMRRNRLSVSAKPHDRTQRSGEGEWRNITALARAAVAWFALVLQYYLTITKPGAPFLEATVRYFSFFSFLTN